MRARYSNVAMRSLELMMAPWRRHMLKTTAVDAADVRTAHGRPLLIVANHTSWWDGFLLRDLHRALRPAGPFHVVMTERELERFPFFGFMGAVPLQAGSVASTLRLIRTLRTAVRHRPDATVVIFPQGRIWPAWRRPLGFARGVDVIARAIAPCAVLPVGIHLESLHRAAPTAFLRCGRVLQVDGDAGTADITADLELRVVECLDTIQRRLALHGESAAQPHGALQ